MTSVDYLELARSQAPRSDDRLWGGVHFRGDTVVGAEVEAFLVGGRRAHARTDSSGTYTFDVARAEALVVLARAPGLVGSTERWVLREQAVDVELIVPFLVRGRLLGPQGPLPGRQLALARGAGGCDGVTSLGPPLHSALTDAEGWFELEADQPGLAIILVEGGVERPIEWLRGDEAGPLELLVEGPFEPERVRSWWHEVPVQPEELISPSRCDEERVFAAWTESGAPLEGVSPGGRGFSVAIQTCPEVYGFFDPWLTVTRRGYAKAGSWLDERAVKDLVLAPGVGRTVTVIDSSGAPMPNCEITARSGGVSYEAERLRSAGRTDAIGVAWLPTPRGQVRISADCGERGHGELDLDADVGTLPIETDYYELKHLIDGTRKAGVAH